jgi:ribosomal protein S18 acetylase RimI-like enzyme
VHPPFRRRGIGRALTQARIAWLMQHTDTVWSTVEEQNLAARALHARTGFTRIASDRGVLLMKTTRPTRHQR